MGYNKFLLDKKKIKPGMKFLVRADFNVVVAADQMAFDPRIQSTAPLIRSLLRHDVHVTVTTHLGRPKVGYDYMYSTRCLVNALEKAYGVDVIFNPDWPFAKKLNVKGSLVLTENVRFLQGELENEANIAKHMVDGYDAFVLEAFATSHRKNASNYGVMDYCTSYLGPHFIEELENIANINEMSEPRVAIIGGGKSDSKLHFVSKLQDIFQAILLGGQMASLFMEAKGLYAGENNFDASLVSKAKLILDSQGDEGKARIFLPKDLWVINAAGDLSLKTVPLSPSVGNVVDIGPMTTNYYGDIIKSAGSILQNGPMGVIENKRCFDGTRSILQSIADLDIETMLGGGDTNLCINLAGLDRSDFGFVSTGGGALLNMVTEETCPALEKLQEHECNS